MSFSYHFKFCSFIQDEGERIAFAFDTKSMVCEVAAHLMSKYPNVLSTVSSAPEGKILQVFFHNYTYEKAYRFRLIIEMELFDKFEGIRTEYNDIRNAWKILDHIDIIESEFKEVGTDLQKEAWMKLQEMVKEIE